MYMSLSGIDYSLCIVGFVSACLFMSQVCTDRRHLFQFPKIIRVDTNEKNFTDMYPCVIIFNKHLNGKIHKNP